MKGIYSRLRQTSSRTLTPPTGFCTSLFRIVGIPLSRMVGTPVWLLGCSEARLLKICARLLRHRSIYAAGRRWEPLHKPPDTRGGDSRHPLEAFATL